MSRQRMLALCGWLALLSLVTGGLGACSDPPRTYPDGVVPLSPQEIVASTTNAMLRLQARDAAFKAGLVTLIAGSESIQTLPELFNAWDAQPAFDGSEELVRDVFVEARADGDWEKACRDAGLDPDAVPDAVSLAGFWAGARKVVES